MEFNGFLFMIILSVLLQSGKAQLKPILINCGGNASSIVDGRKWVVDSVLGNNFTLSSPGIIASAPAINGDSVYEDLYSTARIFNTTSSYNFSMISGSFYIRLHFYPFSSENFDVNKSSFDVRVNNLKLVSKFAVPEEILWKNMRSNSNLSSLMKEYYIDTGSDNLCIEFIPNHEALAFINGIELIPVLDKLFSGSVNKLGSNSLSLIGRGIETMYRLNMGGPELESNKDPNLRTRWESDGKYMFSVNTASTISNNSNISYASSNDSSVAPPLLVYETARVSSDSHVLEKRFNMSWSFGVDPNFDYLVRLHFCEISYDKGNQRVFRIFINNKTAAANYDVFKHAKGMNKAYHEDFIDALPQQVNTLWLQLGPDPSSGAADADAILNGLEIFKLSQNGNLAHVLSRIDTGVQAESGKKRKLKPLLIAVTAGVASLVVFSLLCTVFICFCMHKKKASGGKGNNNPLGWRPLFLHGTLGSTTNARKTALNFNRSSGNNRMGRIFTIAEIKVATDNFNESLVIGIGGFGKVFKGVVDGMDVAVKRAHPQSQQGLKEFETEIEMLSCLRHRHLVSMIGYCDEQNEMILVYEYMAKGTLRCHLFGSDNPPLTWKQRLDVCIGAARGLHYLHTGADRSIIHRDVKTTNILLDENFVAKMADFGLSKTGPALDQTHVSTAVKGSFGYLDPEYFRRQQLTQKSDVYSFGVVLFEVVCARPVINPTLPKDQINLAEWALRWQQQKLLETIVDPRLEGKYSLVSLEKFGEIAEKCLADQGTDRPTMGEVLWYLESVLQLHEERDLSTDVASSAHSKDEVHEMFASLPHILLGEEEDGSGMVNSSDHP